MQVVILAGGMGTRLSEETNLIPKALVRIGGIPIIVHVMSYFASYGHKDFLIATGYKGEELKKYFIDFRLSNMDFEIDLKSGVIQTFGRELDWKIKLVDTGLNTMTGGRIKRIEKFLNPEFFLTYCDGLSNIDLNKVKEIGANFEGIATVTSVNRPSRFGSIRTSPDSELVEDFVEKPSTDWINGGYFYMKKAICDFIEDDNTVLELEPMKALVRESLLITYKHDGFWQPMDNLKEKNYLEKLWIENEAPWRKDTF